MTKHRTGWLATKALYFEGRNWPGARVVGRKELFGDPATSAATDLKPVSIALIETTGRGRPWVAKEAKGFWRSFGEMNTDDDDALADFVVRHGDPDGQLAPNVAIHIGNWFEPMTLCAVIGDAWGQPDAQGVSHFHGGPNSKPLHALVGRIQEVALIGGKEGKPSYVELDHTFGLRLRPPKLSAFMVLSALTMFYERTDMKRCDWCHDWMVFSRSTAKTCSAACRNQLARQSKRATGTDG